MVKDLSVRTQEYLIRGDVCDVEKSDGFELTSLDLKGL